MSRRLHTLGTKEVSLISGVGERKRAALEGSGVNTVLDLLTYYPRRYLDRTNSLAISRLEPGAEATVLARVASVSSRRTRGGKSLVEVVLQDESGKMRCSFFNQRWWSKRLEEGTEVVVAGKTGLYQGSLQMVNPAVDVVGVAARRRTGRIVPIYPQSERAGLATWELEGWVQEALDRAGELSEPLPRSLREEHGLIGRTEAFRTIHAPEDLGRKEVARRRLAFDELVRLQLVLQARRVEMATAMPGISHKADGHDPEGSLARRFVEGLPFELTRSQLDSIEEITADMVSPHPMHRLLQGDVGAGKTVVALAALLIAVQGGHQGALMVPTEVLAEQHAAAVREMTANLLIRDDSTLLGVRPLAVALVTNKTSASNRSRIAGEWAQGAIDILIGTHALLAEDLEPRSLGLVVVDEQHRFGVDQRDTLRSRSAGEGPLPDMLVMTATPIPRTYAMTFFGDLDTTVMRTLPSGRLPIETVWLREEPLAAWQRIANEAAQGRQSFVVCPLVDESEQVQARSATEEWSRLGAEELKGLRIGLLHGQLGSREKEAVMSSFKGGFYDVLVCTTVIEVGVDVPNATVMVVEDAWRFGLAQLHQLRGRVGRSSQRSWCYLLGDPPGDDARARLEAMCATSDGFELAELDLEIRGEGAVLGTTQSGRSSLKLASLRRDKDLLVRARDAAISMVSQDPTLSAFPEMRDEVAAMVDPDSAGFLFKS